METNIDNKRPELPEELLEPKRLTYRQIIDFIDNTSFDVLDGEADVLKTWIEFREIQSVLEDAVKRIKDEAIREVRKYGKDRPCIGGLVIEIAETTKYNYEENADWRTYKAKLKEIEARLKNGFVDPETGEEWAKVSRGGTEYIKVTKQRK